MRIRLPFAATFFLLLLLAGYAGLTSLQLDSLVNDKVLHFITFFLLTLVFYWIVDTSRRRTLHMALVVCTGGLGVGSEVLQGALPNNGRVFDVWDIAANMVGSGAALALCSWYHKRMIERKRTAKYTAVPGGGAEGVEGEEEGVDGEEEVDIELGVVHAGGEAGEGAAAITPAASASTSAPTAPAKKTRSLEDEVDNWDENAEDPWDEDDDDDVRPPAKKRTD